MTAGAGRPERSGAQIILRGLRTPELCIEDFSSHPGEAWCFLGANGSGMETLCDLLTGEAEAGAVTARFEAPAHPGVLSFKGQQAIFEAELRRDETDFIGYTDPGTPARAFIRDAEAHLDLIRLFGLERALDQGYRQLSSGQARKLCLLAQISQGASFLILETPYEGLDRQSCADLDQVLGRLHRQGLAVLIFVHNIGDVPSWCTHLAVIREGLMILRGPLEETLPAARELFAKRSALFRVTVEELRGERRQEADGGSGGELVLLRRGFAGYDGREVFRGLDLTIREGGHTLITGPNGCGKSTLLHLITGDHPLCYANDLHIFGCRRGAGESIWDIKKQMGIVSADLHRNYRVGGTALAVVVSGLFDSIGLYAHPSEAQKRQGLRWLARLHLAAKAARPFRQLSYGEQRLILIARALIKVPRLLVLDEPTQGLDEPNRKALLDFLEEIAAGGICTILYVSHREDEHRDFFTQHIAFS